MAFFMNLSPGLRTRVLVLLGVAAFCAVALGFVRPIAQSLAYHHFADQRALWGIANFADTVSNLPFLFVGIWGIVIILRGVRFIDARERWPYLIFFAGVALTCIGSAYYHLAPDNDRLVWDRVPMTIVFMPLVSALIAERVNLKFGLWLLPILIAVGIGSVVQWHLSVQNGAGDLRFFGAVQLYAVLALFAVLLLPPRYSRGSDLLVVAGLYVLAKICELADRQIF